MCRREESVCARRQPRVRRPPAPPTPWSSCDIRCRRAGRSRRAVRLQSDRIGRRHRSVWESAFLDVSGDLRKDAGFHTRGGCQCSSVRIAEVELDQGFGDCFWLAKAVPLNQFAFSVATILSWDRALFGVPGVSDLTVFWIWLKPM